MQKAQFLCFIYLHWLRSFERVFNRRYTKRWLVSPCSRWSKLAMAQLQRSIRRAPPCPRHADITTSSTPGTPSPSMPRDHVGHACRRTRHTSAKAHVAAADPSSGVTSITSRRRHHFHHAERNHSQSQEIMSTTSADAPSTRLLKPRRAVVGPSSQ
jgi:hypothetical protein